MVNVAAEISANEKMATVRTDVIIPVSKGVARFVTFTGLVDGKEHIALVLGDQTGHGNIPLVRIHSECLTGDVFGSARCDCGEQLNEALETMSRQGGVLLYLRQEGRGIGLYSKLDAYSLQDRGHDTFEANRLLGLAEDSRDYTAAAQMLATLGIDRIRLLSNNPGKAEQLVSCGISVVERIPTQVFLKAQNRGYLLAKAVKGGHAIDLRQINRVLEPVNASVDV